MDEAVPISLRLYIAGNAPNSVAAVANLKNALAQFPEQAVELEIIDVLAHPELASRDNVLVTPTLVKLLPAPQRRLLGNLRNAPLLLGALGLGAGTRARE